MKPVLLNSDVVLNIFTLFLDQYFILYMPSTISGQSGQVNKITFRPCGPCRITNWENVNKFVHKITLEFGYTTKIVDSLE